MLYHVRFYQLGKDVDVYVTTIPELFTLINVLDESDSNINWWKIVGHCLGDFGWAPEREWKRCYKGM